MSKSGNNYYYLQDELGSPMYMTGTDGVAVSSYAFDDFGRNIDPFTGKIKEHKHGYTTDGNIIQPFAFTGYQEDEVSGLKFAQARFYDAENGRFQSEDNVKGFMDSPFTLNHYGYCWGNPINLFDGNGNWPEWVETTVKVVTVTTAVNNTINGMINSIPAAFMQGCTNGFSPASYWRTIGKAPLANSVAQELGGLTDGMAQGLGQFYGNIDNGLIATESGINIDWYDLFINECAE